jgi:hypothetical protein
MISLRSVFNVCKTVAKGDVGATAANNKMNEEKMSESGFYNSIREILRTHRRLFVSVIIAVIVFQAFAGVLENDFILFDDAGCIVRNPMVLQGLHWESVRWAFTTFLSGNWIPATWLSHIMEVELFGIRPAGHHFVNLAFHILSTVILFEILCQTTRRIWLAALAAVLFGIHPLRVESVAWEAERKDVLSCFLGLLAILAYVSYAQKKTFWRYTAVGILLLLGLMSKAMLVTWPLILLLLDIWPLRRWKDLTADEPRLPEQPQTVSWMTLMKEKIPLAILAVIFSVMAFIAQRVENAVVPLRVISLPFRLANVFTSYVQYLGKTIYPVHLALYYPYHSIWLISALLCLAGLVVISGIAVRQFRCRAYILTGWFWFLITLLPVIGLVQIGNQALADRYTYLPSMGLSITIAWIVGGISQRKQIWRRIVTTVSFLVLISLLCLTWRQTYYWKDSLTLFNRTLEITENNWVIEQNYAVALEEAGSMDLAEKHP